MTDSTLEELTTLLQISNVWAEELSVKNDLEVEKADQVDVQLDLDVQRKVEELQLAIRVTANLTSPATTVKVVQGATFVSETAFTVSEDVANEFVWGVAMPALYPFLRQSVRDLSTRVGEDFILPLLPAGFSAPNPE